MTDATDGDLMAFNEDAYDHPYGKFGAGLQAITEQARDEAADVRTES